MVGIALQSNREGSEPMTRPRDVTPVNPGDGWCCDREPDGASQRRTVPYLLFYTKRLPVASPFYCGGPSPSKSIVTRESVTCMFDS